MFYKNIKVFWFPVVLLLITFSLDNFATDLGIKLGFQEGNPIVVWLWSIFGYESILLRVIYLSLIIIISITLSKKIGLKWGLFLLYSFAFGHFLGFSTWINENILNFLTLGLSSYFSVFSIYVLILFAAIYGSLLTLLHFKLTRNN